METPTCAAKLRSLSHLAAPKTFSQESFAFINSIALFKAAWGSLAPMAMATLTASRTSWAFKWTFLANSSIFWQVAAFKRSSHFALVTVWTILTWANLISSLALTAPLTMASFTAIFTSPTLTWSLLAREINLSQVSALRASLHSKLVAFSTSFSRTKSKTSFAFVTWFLAASWIASKTSEAFSWTLLAASRSCWHCSAVRTSSHFVGSATLWGRA